MYEFSAPNGDREIASLPVYGHKWAEKATELEPNSSKYWLTFAKAGCFPIIPLSNEPKQEYALNQALHLSPEDFKTNVFAAYFWRNDRNGDKPLEKAVAMISFSQPEEEDYQQLLTTAFCKDSKTEDLIYDAWRNHDNSVKPLLFRARLNQQSNPTLARRIFGEVLQRDNENTEASSGLRYMDHLATEADPRNLRIE